MHHLDPKDHKDKLYCAFCRNPLTNQEMIVKKFDGDFVSVWCEPCSKLDKQWGPKFLVCCCSEEPKELDVEMAKGEINNTAAKQGIKIELEKPVEFVNIPFKDDKVEEQEEEPTRSTKRKKVRNLW